AAPDSFRRRSVADFEREASLGRDPRTVAHAGRPAGVHALDEGPVELQVADRSVEDVDLLPEGVDLNTRGARVAARLPSQETRRHAAGGVAGEDLLGQARDGGNDGRPR